jgi:[ribosomal protein S5]-alanine N-acetyltransferase
MINNKVGGKIIMRKVYETERLILKVFESEDVNEVKTFWSDREVMEFCSGVVPDEILPKVVSSYNKCHEEKGLSVYGVVEKESGKVIGAAGFNVKDTIEKVELIYHFAKASWGKGFATEAAIACLNIARENGKVKTIYASADPQNMDSLKILEKIGFTYKGMKWFDDTEQEEPLYEMAVIA